MATATVEMEIDLPAGVTIREYQRIDDGHCFHVSWELPTVCRCETCRREAPLDLVEKNKFLAIRDLDGCDLSRAREIRRFAAFSRAAAS